jgi:hypothetical protein
MQQSDKLTDVTNFSAVAVAGLTDMEKREFKKLGKELYGNGNFSGSELIDIDEDPPEEVAAFVTRQLEDGCHPSFLSEGEVSVLEMNYGSEWYLKWGYVEGDLTGIVTVDRFANLTKSQP